MNNPDYLIGILRLMPEKVVLEQLERALLNHKSSTNKEETGAKLMSACIAAAIKLVPDKAQTTGNPFMDAFRFAQDFKKARDKE
jgi:predicted GNAT family N-acyltransferase